MKIRQIKNDITFWIIVFWCFFLIAGAAVLSQSYKKLETENAELIENAKEQEEALTELSSDNENYSRLIEIILTQGIKNSKELDACSAQLEACLNGTPAQLTRSTETMSW